VPGGALQLPRFGTVLRFAAWAALY